MNDMITGKPASSVRGCGNSYGYGMGSSSGYGGSTWG